MTADVTEIALNKINGSFDRFQEAHWWIHTLEQQYHDANLFRWHLNAFLKALKETPLLLQTELQNYPRFSAWFKAQKKKLKNDQLLSFLSDQRNYVVHRGMLQPGSYGRIGITEGRGMKLGFSIPINPLEDSKYAMTRYLHAIAITGDYMGILTPDEDSMPCLQREWRLEPFEEEVIKLAAKAWLTVGEVMTETVRWLGAEVPNLSLNCRHSNQKVQFMLFDREKLHEELKDIQKSIKHRTKHSSATKLKGPTLTHGART